jgi:dihydroorotate dehydrogenase (fumarate)
MMNLSTTYLGLPLSNPLVASAGPLTKDIGHIRQMEDVGLAAIVMHSLFEEQIDREALELDRHLSNTSDVYAESLSYFPDMTSYNIGPDGYLEQLRRAKEAVDVPVIGSLNGTSMGGWIRYAKLIEEAGADALELNIFNLPTDPDTAGSQMEHQYLELVQGVSQSVKIPVAVKMSHFFSSIPHIANRLARSGASGLVLFNRFYQPDFDLEALEVTPALTLSHPNELLLRLHWVAILHGRIPADLAITGGVHSGIDALKAMMAGAQVAMMTSCLLRNGVAHAVQVRQDMEQWMEQHEYVSIRQMQGSMSYQSVPDTTAYERGNYMRTLSSYTLRSPGA